MTLHLGLTKAQLEARRLGIGSSDAYTIAAGTDQERYELWLDKTGKQPLKPPLKPWASALRHHSEPLILDWYEHVNSREVTRRGEAVLSREYPMLRCLLDGADMSIPKVIDAKMLDAWFPNGLDGAREWYLWQIVHQMIVCQIPNGSLYVSLGMKEPIELAIEYDDFTAMQYIDRAREFWAYVQTGKEPPGAPSPMAPPLPLEQMRKLDMTKETCANEWAFHAAGWLANEDAAKKFDAAAKGLKTLVGADVGEARGNGVYAKRDRRGVAIKKGES